MKIRYGDIQNLNEYLKIYESAMKFMANSGNPNQWNKDHHPEKDKIIEHIKNNNYYEIYDPKTGEILAVFALIFGIDETYNEIEGAWINDEPYATIHMVAKKENAKGIFHVISNFAKARCKNVRIDTHKDNMVMQNAILNRGFKYCGIIHLNDKNHSPRMAYQFVGMDIPYDSYKLFVVDYDGTIISSMEMWKHTCSGFLLSMGCKLHEDIDQKVITMTNRDAAAYVQANYLPNLTLFQVMGEMNNYVKKTYVKQRLKPNALELLKKLKSKGRVILYSATSLTLLEASLETLGIKDYFDSIYSGSDLCLSKADGTGFLYVIDKEGFKKEEALVIEDSTHAILGAKKVGLSILGVEDTSNMPHLFVDYDLCDYYLPIK